MSCEKAVFTLVVAALAGAGQFAVAADAGTRPERALRRSDVVFFIDNPTMYEPYGCTVVGWGGVAKPERVRGAHEKGVRLYATAVAFRTAFHRVMDFSDDYLDAACRNYAGEPFAVPWLWDHKYKGQPVWWGCTNSPLYHEYLEDRLATSMGAGPDGLHIDDYSGTAGAVTWLSGGFCRHCMAGFREYVAEHVSPTKLADLGITSSSSTGASRPTTTSGADRRCRWPTSSSTTRSTPTRSTSGRSTSGPARSAGSR